MLPSEPDESHLISITRLPLLTNNHSEGDIKIKLSRIRPADRRGFKTAIIYALTLEADAIEALFDHHWEDDNAFYSKAPSDPNDYSTGIMGQHNIILAFISGIGKTTAATAAVAYRMSFPNIDLAILVGVYGAVPIIPSTGKKINLGDISISNGVIQYDFSR